MLVTTRKNKPLRWQRSRYSLLARQVDVFSAAAKFALDIWWDSTIAHSPSQHRHRRAQWLVGTLLDLGPTFIKIGQALSTRADLLPVEYVQALSKLQDQVPAFSVEEAIQIIETELGKSIHSLFRDFDRDPLAAASLGQVHKARLHTGEDVVVKVQRPNLERLFDLDFQALHNLMRFCQRYIPQSRKYDLDAIYHEFFSILYQEIDYVQEGKHADRFRQNFKDYPKVRAPKVYWHYSTHRVLTLEYLPGIKVNDRQSLEACGINIKDLNALGVSCYLKQLLQDGFFQADPHPGNMAVAQDGTLIFYDFGMMAEVKPVAQGQMTRTFFAMLRKDTEEVVETLLDLGLLVPARDMTPVKRVVSFALERFIDQPVDFKAFAQLRGEIYEIFQQQPFRLPAQMTYILKSLTTLDGIARSLDPEYSLLAGAQPFIRSLATAKGQGTIVLGELARQAKNFVQNRLNQPSRTEVMLRRLEERLERGELKLRVRSVETDRALKQINLAVKSLIYACLTGFTLLSGAVLLPGAYQIWAIVLFGLSGLSFTFLLGSLIKLNIQEKLDQFIDK